MRVAVFGPAGMLGKHVMRQLAIGGHVGIPVHRRMFELLSLNSVTHVLDESNAEGVINCAGVIPIKLGSADTLTMIDVNGKFPWVLTRAAGDRPVLLVSTDCVFSGRNRYKYKVEDIPDPRDLYGKSKALGEVVAANAMVVRTSFIGCDHGLMHSVMQAGQLARTSGNTVEYEGWKNALWTGSTVQAVAASLVRLLVDEFQPGLAHLASEMTHTKFDVVSKIVELNEFDVSVKPVTYPIFCRSLTPTHVLQDVNEALDEYECVRRVVAA